MKRLIQAIDRGTWIREYGGGGAGARARDPELGRAFDRAGRMRTEAVQAADELAAALADAKGGLTIGRSAAGLRCGAQGAGERGSDRADAGAPRRAEARAGAAPSAASVHRREQPGWCPPIRSWGASSIGWVRTRQRRSARAWATWKRPSRDRRSRRPRPPRPRRLETRRFPPPGDAKEAEAPSPTLNIANDAAALLAKRAPRAITLREDGLFELSYDDANYLVDPQGKLIRKEPPSRR